MRILIEFYRHNGWANGRTFDLCEQAADGLIQVISHSSQHRAQIRSVLGQHGVQVPDLDYVLMLRESRSGATT